MKHIFIIGSKGIPARYGGFETFVHKLTEYKVSPEIRYHVACLAKDNEEFYFNGARCFNIKVPNIGPARAVIYDILAVKRVLEYVKTNNIKNPVIYILACRIGPFLKTYIGKLKKSNIKVYVNPDGHEWMRSKWNTAVKKYWRYSERLMVKCADLLVCDSKGIQKYIEEEYSSYKPSTTFIAYGADVDVPGINNEEHSNFNSWLQNNHLKNLEYYLIVGRFVPENNYELIISEFMKSKTEKDLVIITNHEYNPYYDSLKQTTGFHKDKRIKFVGTVYDEKLLFLIRKSAFGYLHGHEVGGTNPSLLEALSTTSLNLLLDVVFNKEVAEDGALYFNKKNGDLALLLNRADKLNEEEINTLDKKARNRIKEHYSWDYIVSEYETLFLQNEEC